MEIYAGNGCECTLPLNHILKFIAQMIMLFVCTCVLNRFSCVQLCDPMDCCPPDSSVHGFSRQEYWSGLPCPPPGELPTQGSNPQLLQLLHCGQILYHQATREAQRYICSKFSRSVVSDSLRPHESQHARPPCPSPTPGVYPNSCPLSQWCHPAISSSVVPFSSSPQSFPASGSFPMSLTIVWG